MSVFCYFSVKNYVISYKQYIFPSFLILVHFTYASGLIALARTFSPRLLPVLFQFLRVQLIISLSSMLFIVGFVKYHSLLDFQGPF